MKICQRCGTRLPEGAGFCTRCGAPAGRRNGPRQAPGVFHSLETSQQEISGDEEPRTEQLPREYVPGQQSEYGPYGQGQGQQRQYQQGQYQQGQYQRGQYQQGVNPQAQRSAQGYLREAALPLAVYVFAAVIILLFLIVELTGGSDDIGNMIRWGAVFGPRIVEKKEYWRFLSAAFLHFGIAHISNNMLVLFVMGPQLERVLGHLKFALFYPVSAVAANIIAFFIQFSEMDYRVSAGASGAIFAVCGGLLWAALRNHGRAGTLAVRQILVFTVLSMAYGLTGEDVDNTVHIAGFVIGFLLSILLFRPERN